MSEYSVELRRAPGMSEAERRRRLHAAYSILLEAARRKQTTASEDTTDDDNAHVVDYTYKHVSCGVRGAQWTLYEIKVEMG